MDTDKIRKPSMGACGKDIVKKKKKKISFEGMIVLQIHNHGANKIAKKRRKKPKGLS